MKRKLINFVTSSLHNTGLRLLKQKTRYHQRWFLVGCFAYFSYSCITTIILSLVSEDDFIYRLINPVPYVSLGVIIDCGIVTMLMNKKVISQMLHEMDERVFVYPDEDLLSMQYEWYLDEGNLIVVMVVIFCAQVSLLCELCIPAAYQLYNYGRIKTFIYPGWNPWSTQKVSIQLVTMVVQFFGTISGLWLNQMMLMPVLLMLCEFLRQYKRLRKAVVTLEWRSDPTEADFDRRIRQNIVYCVVHMQKLRRNFCMFEIWFSKMFSYELAVCASSLAIAIYLLTTAASLSKTYNLIIVVLFMNINLLARCLMGEIFFDLNDEIAYAILAEIKWYNLSKENQKLLIMFHHMARQPLTLFGFKIFPITRVMFAKIIRTTYSVFNVIKVSLN